MAQAVAAMAVAVAAVAVANGSGEDTGGEDASKGGEGATLGNDEGAPGEDAPLPPLGNGGLGSGNGSGNGNGCRPRWQGQGRGRQRTSRLGGRGTEAERREWHRQWHMQWHILAPAAKDAAPVVPASPDAVVLAPEDAGDAAAAEGAVAAGDAADAWRHDSLPAEELAAIAQRVADQADARHAERHAELDVAAAAAESACPAAEQAVAVDELARLTEMNRQLGQLQGGRAGAAGTEAPEAEAAGEDALGDAAEDGGGFLSQEELAVIAQRIADRADARHDA